MFDLSSLTGGMGFSNQSSAASEAHATSGGPFRGGTFYVGGGAGSGIGGGKYGWVVYVVVGVVALVGLVLWLKKRK